MMLCVVGHQQILRTASFDPFAGHILFLASSAVKARSPIRTQNGIDHASGTVSLALISPFLPEYKSLVKLTAAKPGLVSCCGEF